MKLICNSCFLVIALLYSMLHDLSADSRSRILVTSWASEDFVRVQNESGEWVPEICAFLKGHYYSDAIEEAEEAVSFETVTQILAPEMMKHNFILNQPPEIVDYILLVNWGFTEEAAEDAFDFLEEDIMIVENEDGFFEEMSTFSSNSFSNTGSENAKLIGATKMSQLYPYSLKRQLLLEAAEEKRLFVNVTAFERNHLINKAEADKLKPAWITFFSIPFYDIECAEALQAISEMGSRFMGSDLDSPSFIDYRDRKYSTTPEAFEYLGIEGD